MSIQELAEDLVIAEGYNMPISYKGVLDSVEFKYYHARVLDNMGALKFRPENAQPYLTDILLATYSFAIKHGIDLP